MYLYKLSSHILTTLITCIDIPAPKAINKSGFICTTSWLRKLPVSLSETFNCTLLYLYESWLKTAFLALIGCSITSWHYFILLILISGFRVLFQWLLARKVQVWKKLGSEQNFHTLLPRTVKLLTADRHDGSLYIIRLVKLEK